MTSGCRGTLYFEEIRLGLGLETGDFVQESRGGYRRTTLICFQQYAIHFPSSSKVPSPKSAAVSTARVAWTAPTVGEVPLFSRYRILSPSREWLCTSRTQNHEWLFRHSVAYHSIVDSSRMLRPPRKLQVAKEQGG